jgi:uncharacterized protein (DUF3820 family)
MGTNAPVCSKSIKFLKDHGIVVERFLRNDSLPIEKKMTQPIYPDKKAFIALAITKMPFGKYKGIRLVDLPEPYLVWFSQKGFPEGKLGEMLQSIYEIKLNGLEYLFKDASIKEILKGTREKV